MITIGKINHYKEDFMSVQLLIQDGNPYWYLSPDIWVVPGNDPSGSPGTPIAGQHAYIWARVANISKTNDAKGVIVDFYWANPALQVTRSNAHKVGSAFADIPAGGMQNVLCLVPWNPIIVNNGHECLIAVVNHADDPLPSPLPDAFDPPTYRQVAQKNLTVLAVTKMQAAMLTITVSGLQRADKFVVLTTEQGGELDAATLASLGLSRLQPAKESIVEVSIDQKRHCPDDDNGHGKDRIKLHVPKGTSTAVHVTVRARNLTENEYQFIQIVERSEDKVLGGLGLVVVSEKPATENERREKQL